MAKSAKYSRIPSQSDLDAFSGMHCADLYRQALATGWRCPSCRRSVQELVRWTEIRGSHWRERFGDEHGMGFTISMAKHHCHGSGRFPTTTICGDCNSADGAAKRVLRLPQHWSFSPEEIGQFVTVAPYSGKTTINYEAAQKIFERLPHYFWKK